MSLTWEEPEPAARGATWDRDLSQAKRYLKTSNFGRASVAVIARGHPLASRSGHLLLARLTLWEKLGRPAQSQCFYCQWLLTWLPTEGVPSVQVDHLDGVTTHDDPGNLVPACHWCNSGRYHLKAHFPEILALCVELDPRIRSAWLALLKASVRYTQVVQKLEAEL